MDVLWNRSEGNVRDVIQLLARPLAYTTVMTTLDRLYKKGLLSRRKFERAFIYAPRLSRQQWEQKRAGDFLAAFLARPANFRRRADLLFGGCRRHAGRSAARRARAQNQVETQGIEPEGKP